MNALKWTHKMELSKVDAPNYRILWSRRTSVNVLKWTHQMELSKMDAPKWILWSGRTNVNTSELWYREWKSKKVWHIYVYSALYNYALEALYGTINYMLALISSKLEPRRKISPWWKFTRVQYAHASSSMSAGCACIQVSVFVSVYRSVCVFDQMSDLEEKM